jgi:phage recombination protein Bet
MEEKGLVNYTDPSVIETLKKTVAAGASAEEFAMFTQFCKSTGLNPFKKEIWFIKTQNRVQLMTGINGYWAIANKHPQFDGTEQEIATTPQGDIVSATCKVYRKDRRFPSVGIALMKEYKKSTPIWSQMPSVMLMKCAESIALRKAFPQELNGLYTEEEMPREYAAAPAVAEPKAPAVLPADDIIEQGPFYYDISTMPPAAKKKALAYLGKQEGIEEWLVDSVYISDVPLKKLINYRIDKLPARPNDPLDEQLQQFLEQPV